MQAGRTPALWGPPGRGRVGSAVQTSACTRNTNQIHQIRIDLASRTAEPGDGAEAGLWCWVGREGAGLKWRGDSTARRKGLGSALQLTDQLPAPRLLIPVTITVPRPCPSCLCLSPLPPCPAFIHVQVPVGSLPHPTPLSGRIMCCVFCHLRHVLILTQYNWTVPVGQY